MPGAGYFLAGGALIMWLERSLRLMLRLLLMAMGAVLQRKV